METTDLFEPIASDLEAVEQTLVQAGTDSRVRLLADVGNHILSGGGKRVRPALTLFSGVLCETPAERRIAMAASVELIHNATLLHDDIVDEACIRRGKPPAHLLWGRTAGVLTADYHFSRAFSLVLDAGGMPCLDLLNRTILTIVEGELQQFLRVGFTELDEDDYREIIQRKTAELIATSCRLGSLPGPGRHLADSLSGYGLDLGMAFQMMDDLLDYTAEESALGKKVGTDFREAKMTLPLITALARCGGAEREELLGLLHGDPAERDSAFPWAKALIEKHGGFRFTYRSAAAHAEQAVEAIRDLPAVRTRHALEHLARFVVERTF